MDNSSRNIIKFIVAITGAALLIMGARFYADSQKVAPPVEVAEKTATPKVVVEEPAEETILNPDDDTQNSATEVIEEDAELIMGEPSMNLEMGGASADAPPVQSAPSPEPQPEQ